MLVNVSEFRRNISHYLSLVYYRNKRIKIKRGNQILAVINSPQEEFPGKDKSFYTNLTAKIEKNKKKLKNKRNLRFLSRDIDRILYSSS